jgi:hypothetical protein
VNFGFFFNGSHVTISPSTGSTATIVGEKDYSLNCSTTLTEPSRLPSDVPSPNFQWSFNNCTSLPSGVTAMPTDISSSNSTSETYTSTLQFSQPLSQFHAGMYTCRLGPGRLMNNTVVTVNGKTIIHAYKFQISCVRARLLVITDACMRGMAEYLSYEHCIFHFGQNTKHFPIHQN